MKRDIIYAAINNVLIQAGEYLSALNGVQITEAVAEKGLWFLVTPFGDYEQSVVDMRTKANVPAVQRIDAESAEKMVSSFNSFTSGIKHLGKGLPIYAGHADAPNKASDPSNAPTAVGRLKKLEVRESGLWGYGVFNQEGVDLISGEAPKYSATSPFFLCTNSKEKVDGKIIITPFRIKSIALTNDPNLPDCYIGLNQQISDTSGEGSEPKPIQNNTMNEEELMELRKALDLPETATVAEIVAKIAELKANASNAKAKASNAEAKANTAESGLAAANSKLEKLEGEQVVVALNSAVQAGKITEAQRENWKGVLEANFMAGKAALDGMVKVTALNSTDHLQGQQPGNKQLEGSGVDYVALNQAVQAELSQGYTQAQYDSCYDKHLKAAKAK